MPEFANDPLDIPKEEFEDFYDMLYKKYHSEEEEEEEKEVEVKKTLESAEQTKSIHVDGNEDSEIIKTDT